MVVFDIVLDNLPCKSLTALLLFRFRSFFLSGGVAASPCAKGKGFREWKGMESVLDKSVIDCSLLNISLFNCVGFSNVGFSCVGFSNVGLSNVGFSNVGKSNIGGCPPLVAASGSRGCGCSYMTYLRPAASFSSRSRLRTIYPAFSSSFTASRIASIFLPVDMG